MIITLPDVILWTCYFVSMYFSLFWLLVLIDNHEKIKKERIKPINKKKLPRVTIALPAWNEEKRGLRKTIESVLALNYPRSKLQIIAVNHGSTDNTGRIMDDYKDQITVLHIKRTPQDRKGVAMNKALEIATGDYFISMDCDSSIESDALYKLLPEFDDEKVACVLPIMKADLNYNKSNNLQRFQHFEYIVNFFYKKIMGFLQCINVAPGPFSIYRTKIVKNIGGYENYNLTEDLELTIRLQKYGYKILQVQHTLVKTLVPNNIKDYISQRKRWFMGGVINALKHKDMLFNKKYGDFGLMQMPVLILSGVIAISLISLFFYLGVKSFFTSLYKLYLINFDIGVFLQNLTWNFSILDISAPTIIIMIFTLLISLYMLYNSFRRSDERIRKFGLFNLALFLLFYFFILAYVWVLVALDLIAGKQQVW